MCKIFGVTVLNNLEEQLMEYETPKIVHITSEGFCQAISIEY